MTVTMDVIIMIIIILCKLNIKVVPIIMRTLEMVTKNHYREEESGNSRKCKNNTDYSSFKFSKNREKTYCHLIFCDDHQILSEWMHE